MNGCWKPNHIPFPFFYRSVKQTNHKSLYKNGITFRRKNSMLLSLLEMQLRERVWTEQLLKRLSIVGRSVAWLDKERLRRRLQASITHLSYRKWCKWCISLTRWKIHNAFWFIFRGRFWSVLCLNWKGVFQYLPTHGCRALSISVYACLLYTSPSPRDA